MEIQPIVGYFWGYTSHLPPPPFWISAPFLHILDPPLFLHVFEHLHTYLSASDSAVACKHDVQ